MKTYLSNYLVNLFSVILPKNKIYVSLRRNMLRCFEFIIIADR